MKVAVIGSRNIVVTHLADHLPKGTTEIVSGGAKGVDTSAADYARAARLTLTEFLPDYQKYGRAAPIVRNKQLVEYADVILAFWDGSSKGTYSVIRYCEKVGKPCTVIRVDAQ